MLHLLPRLACVAAILLWVSVCAPFAQANGVYMPEQAYPAMPSIPVQRAIIAHRGGQETLVVESAVQSSSPTVGWILPLPAQPTRIEKGEPGMLVSASIALRPKLIHDLSRPWEGAPWLLLLLAPPLLVTILIRDPRTRAAAITRAYIVSLFLLFLLSILLSLLSTASESTASTPSGISVLNVQRVGDYDVTVLEARSADDLSHWLTDHKLQPLTATGRAVADSYISGNWCFAVAQLHLSDDKVAMPHPLSVTFPAATPVFPMRLTALAQTTTRVELMVIGDQQAQAAGFRVSCCDRFAPGYDSDWRAEKTNLQLAHPAVAKLMWDNCIVTKLTADLHPVDMHSDVNITLAGFMPCRDTFWTSRGRSELIISILAYGGLLVAVAIAIAFRGRRLPSRTGVRGLGAVVLALLLACAGTYAFLPVVPVAAAVDLGHFWAYRQRDKIVMVLGEHLDELGSASDKLGSKVTAILRADPTTATNQLQGGPIRWECSPGNVGLSRDDKDTIVLYNVDCVEFKILSLSAKP